VAAVAGRAGNLGLRGADAGLNGKVVLVTGAGSQIGIGRTIALLAAERGATVFANDVIEDDLALTVEQVRAAGGEVTGHVTDVSDRASVEAMVAECERVHGRVDVLVNNAGIAKKARFIELTDEQVAATMGVNFGGTLNCSRAVAPGMVERGAGAIVSFSSLMGHPWGWNEHVHYSASKAAIEGLTRALAVELGPAGVRVNAVAPGFIETAQSTSREHSVGPEGLKLAIPYIPLGRIGDPADVAEVVLFLASDAARYITGQVLLVDGGITLGDLRKAFEPLDRDG
jgi:3-oxoacyl-[acyl-carrier protein] reductase